MLNSIILINVTSKTQRRNTFIRSKVVKKSYYRQSVPKGALVIQSTLDKGLQYTINSSSIRIWRPKKWKSVCLRVRVLACVCVCVCDHLKELKLLPPRAPGSQDGLLSPMPNYFIKKLYFNCYLAKPILGFRNTNRRARKPLPSKS